MTGFYLPTPAGVIYRLALDGGTGSDLQWATDPEGPVELLREWAGPPYCAEDEESAEDMRLAAGLIDTDTGRTNG